MAILAFKDIYLINKKNYDIYQVNLFGLVGMHSTMLLDQLQQLPSPAGNYGLLKQFANTLAQYEIGHADVPELLEIATDTELYNGTDREFFATHYAMYALAALKQVNSCPKIIDYLNHLHVEDEWLSSYISVFEMMGEKAIPYLIEACRTIRFELLFVLTESLAKLAILYPTYRDQILSTFDDIFFRVREYSINKNTVTLVENSLLVGWLNMLAVEKLETISEIQRNHQLDQHVVEQIEILAQEHQAMLA